MPIIAMTVEQTIEKLDGDMERRTITKISAFTRKRNTMALTAPAFQWKNFDEGRMKVQMALPALSDTEREFLLTGTTQVEWDAAFPEKEEKPESVIILSSDDDITF